MSELPADLTDALSSRYQFVRELGSGGMATVYLAHDLRHERDVAVKVLKPEVGAAIGVHRFLAEIRLTGNLKHPHILPLFDSGSAGSLLFYVMPFIDGESLGTRLRQHGRLKVAEVIHILQQVADALACAHQALVIHRDLKPDNILISGRHVFLADFGIARLDLAATSVPTLTATGAIAGTPGYMAPEQIVGDEIDYRCDIYAFGVLGYELLTGMRPFQGSRQDVFAAQLTRSPEPVTRLRPDTPPQLAALVMRSLERRAADRWQRAEDVRAALEDMEKQGVSDPAFQKPSRRLLLFVVGGIALAIASFGMSRILGKGSASPALSVGQVRHFTSEPGLELDPAIGPDGRTIAYVAGFPGKQRVVLRQLTGSQIVPLVDESFGEIQRWPQWSPDGTHIVFQAGRRTNGPGQVSVAGGEIDEAPALGGTARRLIQLGQESTARTPSYSLDGRQVVYADTDGLYVIDASAGARRLLADPGAHSPRWSPDGAMIAYVHGGVIFSLGEEMLGNTETSSLRVWIAKTGQVRQITTGDWLNTNPVWLPQGRTLLFVSNRGGSPDIYSIRLTAGGDPDGEAQRLTSGANALGLSVSPDGRLLAYSAFSPNNTIWSIDIPAKGVASVAQARQVTLANERIEKLTVSPDGKWLAYDSDRNGLADVWKAPIAGGAPQQITQGPNPKFVNDWSPDGQEISYHSIRGGQRDLFVVSADGTHTEAVTATPGQEEQHSGWGPDGNSLVFDALPAGSMQAAEAYIVTRARRGAPWGTPRRLTTHRSADPKWSPDGRLIAFCSGGELRVIAPDGTGERVVVSSMPDGSTPSYPVWSKDSRSIYYKAYDRDRNSTIWSVPVTGGPARLLVRFDDPSRRSLRREFATDGIRLYFTVARYESDIWTMEIQRK